MVSTHILTKKKNFTDRLMNQLTLFRFLFGDCSCFFFLVVLLILAFIVPLLILFTLWYTRRALSILLFFTELRFLQMVASNQMLAPYADVPMIREDCGTRQKDACVKELSNESGRNETLTIFGMNWVLQNKCLNGIQVMVLNLLAGFWAGFYWTQQIRLLGQKTALRTRLEYWHLTIF